MRWFTAPEPEDKPKTVTFKLACRHCLDVYEVEVENTSVTQKVCALCPACNWVYETFERFASDGHFFLANIQHEMWGTVEDWAAEEKWIKYENPRNRKMQ